MRVPTKRDVGPSAGQFREWKADVCRPDKRRLDRASWVERRPHAAARAQGSVELLRRSRIRPPRGRATSLPVMSRRKLLGRRSTIASPRVHAESYLSRQDRTGSQAVRAPNCPRHLRAALPPRGAQRTGLRSKSRHPQRFFGTSPPHEARGSANRAHVRRFAYWRRRGCGRALRRRRFAAPFPTNEIRLLPKAAERNAAS